MAEIPDWGKRVFSQDAILIKPGNANQDGLLQACNHAVRSMVDLVCNTEIGNLPNANTPLEKRGTYLYHHAHDEPAGPFLERLGGKEWAQGFIHDFLFPQWLIPSEALPPWQP